jgi:hypothetical protein
MTLSGADVLARFRESLYRLASVGILAAVLIILLRDYASVEWWVYGFDFVPPGMADFYELAIFIVVTAAFLPSHIRSPSSLILILVYLLLIVPAAVCATGMGLMPPAQRLQFFAVLGISYMAACLINRQPGDALAPPIRHPHRLVVPLMVLFAGVLLLYLVYRYRDIMSFASLDTLYEQRAKGAADTLLDGYAQTYSQYVLSTGLVAFGLVRRNIFLIGFGIVGSIANFMITAEKAGFIYPFIIVAIYLMVQARGTFIRSIHFMALSLAGVLYISLQLYQSVFAAEFTLWYVGIRSMMTPGGFLIHYLQFFADRGHTYFSHIRGLDILIGVPNEYFNDPRWPAIGVIIGEDYFRLDDLNANANFIASDGAASLGLIGVPIVVMAFAGLLKLFDKVSKGVGPLSLLLLLPIGLTLTNGSLFTILTSFGGLLWIGLLKFGFAESFHVAGAAPKGQRTTSHGGRAHSNLQGSRDGALEPG